MAESVELRMEDAIPELEEMEKHQLFDKDEIKTIAKRRQEFEYRLHRQTKNKEDCLHYIQYEMNLLKMVRLRRQKNNLSQKKINIEYSIANRLNKLFNEAIRRFQDDVRVWLSYIRFCKQVRFYTSASRVFYQLLELHGKDKPMLYKLASNWELEECKCIEKARKFLLNGLHIHKDSILLYTEAFKLELYYANERRNEAKASGSTLDPTDPVFQGHHAEIIYQSAVKKIPDVSFLVELLELAKKYDFTLALQNKILSDLQSMFPSDELTWDTIAKNELSGVKDKKISYKERIRRCVGIYKKYVKILKTERMWSMYIDTLLDLHKDTSTYPNFKRNILSNGLTAAHIAEKLPEKYYFIWVDQLKGVDKAKKLTQILQQATDRLSSSVPLWEMRLRIHLSRGEEKLADEAFKQGNVALGPNALSLWKLMLLYYQAKNSTKAEEIFKEGTKGTQCPQVSNPLKVLYLERLAVTKGISAARKAYEQLAQTPPFCLEIHSKMVALESFQPEPSVKHARSCHTLACKQFGSHNTDVWMDYIKFESKRGDPSLVSSIYMKAIGMLKKKSLVDSFISEYNLGKSNSTI